MWCFSGSKGAIRRWEGARVQEARLQLCRGAAEPQAGVHQGVEFNLWRFQSRWEKNDYPGLFCWKIHALSFSFLLQRINRCMADWKSAMNWPIGENRSTTIWWRTSSRSWKLEVFIFHFPFLSTLIFCFFVVIPFISTHQHLWKNSMNRMRVKKGYFCYPTSAGCQGELGHSFFYIGGRKFTRS